MELDSHIIELLELYVNNQASKQQRKEVDALVKNNSEIAAMLQAMQLLKTELINLEIIKAKALLVKLREQKQIKKQKPTESDNNSLAHQLKETLHYTVEQLQKLFAPQAIYEQHISNFSLRAASYKLLQPEQGLDCSNYQLQFELQNPVNKGDEIEIIIENNQYEELLVKEYISSIPAPPFILHLNPEIFTTGRYYWKFSVEDQVIIGSFFINKQLMPAK